VQHSGVQRNFWFVYGLDLDLDIDFIYPDLSLLGISGLVGVYVTVPNTLNMLSMLDWACLAPR